MDFVYFAVRNYSYKLLVIKNEILFASTILRNVFNDVVLNIGLKNESKITTVTYIVQ